MLFTVFDDSGMITQSNQVYDQKNYGDLLDKHDYRFLRLDRTDVLSPTRFFVENACSLRRRPPMAVRCSRTELKAGDHDAIVFSNLPEKCRMTIRMQGHLIQCCDLSAHRIEVGAAVPGRYSVEFEKFPFQTWSIEIMAS